MSNTDWQANGACRTEDPDLFFPTGETRLHLAKIEEAKAVCRRCPVADTCLRWALDSGQDSGIWGGLTEKQRRRIHRRETRVPIAFATGPRALADVLAERSTTGADGHTAWVASTPVTVNNVCYTPPQLAWWVAYGEAPIGEVRSTCGHRGCITISHLLDADGRAVQHGKYAAWEAHRKADEPLCEACQGYQDQRARTRREQDQARRDRNRAAKQAAA